MPTEIADPNPWQLGQIYVVRAQNGGCMGRLASIYPVELVFERVDCDAPEFPGINNNELFFRGNNVIIVSRYAVSSAELVTEVQR